MRRREVMVVCMMMFLMASVTAGVGIKWEEESILVVEGESRCMNYKVYNPWPEGTNVKISLSGDVAELLKTQETDSVFVPAETSSKEAIPVEFCFDAPKKVYPRDCIAGTLCKPDCSVDMETYEGDVVVSSVPGGDGSGSATKASVTAPLRVRVKCEDSGRDLTALYVLIAIVALVCIYWFMRKRNISSKPVEKPHKKKKKKKKKRK